MSQEQQQLFPYLQRLLNGAPVEWKPLGEVATLQRGKTITRKSSVEGDYPVISGGQQPAYYIDQFNRTGETITVAGSGAYAGFLMYWKEPIFVSDAFSIKPKQENILLRYIYYFLLNIQDKIYQLKTGSGVPHVYAKDVARFVIPIPPMEVQERIVEILDKFTELQAELQAELALREKQYIYFRDQLLSFDEGAVRWESLDQVFEIRNGYTPSKKQPDFWKGGTIPWYRMEDIRANGRVLRGSIQHITPAGVKGKGLFKANSIIMATTATIGEHALLIADSLANQRFTNFAIRESLKKDINHWFAFYYFFKICEWCKSNVYESSFPSVDMKKLKMLPFPIPPMEEQERIVGILDRFETMVHSIKEGLPREIELRRKQYEYFRDQLLTFPKG